MTEPDSKALSPSRSPNASHRFRALDSLRGIAACTVVLGHFCNLAPLIFLRKTPMRLLLGGHEAVLLFFVLSGFVLTVQITSRTTFNYLSFTAQRVTRIYIPYVCAFAIGLTCYWTANAHPAPWAGPWFNDAWQSPLPKDVIAGHLALVLPFHTAALVPVFWTLVYEMRVSLLLPLGVFAAQRLSAVSSIALGLLFSSVCYALISFENVTDLTGASIGAEWAPTLHYAGIFMAGIVLALHRDVVVAFIRKHTKPAFVLVAGVLLFYSGSPVGFVMHDALGAFVYDWLVAAGAALIVAATLAGESISRALVHPVLTFLGDISYSLYLLHTVVLLTAVHLAGRAIPWPVTVVAALGLTIPAAYLSYRFIEVPTIRLGRKLAERIRDSSASAMRLDGG